MAEPSAFDPIAFLSAQQNEVNEKRSLVPAGWYTAFIGEVGPNAVKTGEKDGRKWLKVNVPIRVQLAGAAPDLGSEFILTDGVFIDLNDSGAVDNTKGKNNRQRIYREAVGMNQAGAAFSWTAMAGRPIKVEVIHKVLADQRIVENVGNVLPA